MEKNTMKNIQLKMIGIGIVLFFIVLFLLPFIVKPSVELAKENLPLPSAVTTF